MKSLLWIVVIILFTGMWFGINIAKDRPLFSNPFEDADLRERAAQEANNVLRESKEALVKKLQEQE